MRLKAVTPLIIFIFAALIFSPGRLLAAPELSSIIERDASALKEDYRGFYLDTGNIVRLATAAAVAGVLANTSADREVQEYYRDNIRSSATDNASKVFKIPGELLVTVPIVAGARLFMDEDTAAGKWADRSLRALLVGGPAGLILQRATGAGRPNEGDSKWRPFKNNNGLSGHAFVGAVPFIAAARMQEDPYLKGVFYALSALPAASRVNDDKHYLSQTLLGWYLAYLSVSAVDRESAEKASFFIVPLDSDGAMAQLSFIY